MRHINTLLITVFCWSVSGFSGSDTGPLETRFPGPGVEWGSPVESSLVGFGPVIVPNGSDSNPPEPNTDTGGQGPDAGSPPSGSSSGSGSSLAAVSEPNVIH